MNIGLFGGTFDPIHVGHLLIAEAAREYARLERVIFLPTFHPPHKTSVVASPEDRLAMTRLAVRGNRHFEVSDWEIRRRRMVYTYEALGYFQGRHPRARLHFIVGSDSLRDIRSWRHGPSLLSRAHFLIADRAAAPWKKIPPSLKRRASRIACTAIDLASHEIRRRVARGQSIRYQVPETVERYIGTRRLYRRAHSC